MYDRSQASASSNNVPANALPGSMSAKKAPRRQIKTFQRALDQQDDLAHQPVIAVLARVRSTARHASGSPVVRTRNRADLGLVHPQPQDRIVQLTECPKRPETIARRTYRLWRCRLGFLRRLHRELSRPVLTIDRERHRAVGETCIGDARVQRLRA
jgi:hypothetical protein